MINGLNSDYYNLNGLKEMNINTLNVDGDLTETNGKITASEINMTGSITLHDNKLILKDASHFLAYSEYYDGPILVGYNGGSLGLINGNYSFEVQPIMNWNANGVNITQGTLTVKNVDLYSYVMSLSGSVTNCLPLSGGSMTGSITMNKNPLYVNDDNSSYLKYGSIYDGPSLYGYYGGDLGCSYNPLGDDFAQSIMNWNRDGVNITQGSFTVNNVDLYSYVMSLSGKLSTLNTITTSGYLQQTVINNYNTTNTINSIIQQYYNSTISSTISSYIMTVNNTINNNYNTQNTVNQTFYNYYNTLSGVLQSSTNTISAQILNNYNTQNTVNNNNSFYLNSLSGYILTLSGLIGSCSTNLNNNYNSQNTINSNFYISLSSLSGAIITLSGLVATANNTISTNYNNQLYQNNYFNGSISSLSGLIATNNTTVNNNYNSQNVINSGYYASLFSLSGALLSLSGVVGTANNTINNNYNNQLNQNNIFSGSISTLSGLIATNNTTVNNNYNSQNTINSGYYVSIFSLSGAIVTLSGLVSTANNSINNNYNSQINTNLYISGYLSTLSGSVSLCNSTINNNYNNQLDNNLYISGYLSTLSGLLSSSYNTLNNKFSSYLPLSGGTMTGLLTCNSNMQTYGGLNSINCKSSSGWQEVNMKLHNAPAGAGSPNGFVLGITAPQYNGVAYIDTEKNGVAGTTPLSIRMNGTEYINIAANGNITISTISGTTNILGTLYNQGTDLLFNIRDLRYNLFSLSGYVGNNMMRYKGDFSLYYYYNYLDIVYNNGSSYIYIGSSPTIGKDTTTINYWNKLADKGDIGPTGPTGPTGPAGKNAGSGGAGTIMADILGAGAAVVAGGTAYALVGIYAELALLQGYISMLTTQITTIDGEIAQINGSLNMLEADTFFLNQNDFNSTLNVAGNLNCRNNTVIQGYLTCNAQTNLNGNTNIFGNLNVQGFDHSLYGAMSQVGRLSLTGDLQQYLGNFLTSGSIKTQSTLTVQGETDLISDLLVNGHAVVNKTFAVGGNTTLMGATFINDTLGCAGKFRTNADAYVDNTIFADNAVINKTLKVGDKTVVFNMNNTVLETEGAMRVNGNAIIKGAFVVYGDLFVTGNIFYGGKCCQVNPGTWIDQFS